MPRIVKEEDYAARRKEILDVAQRLVYTKGYEKMSIQDILDALKISRVPSIIILTRNRLCSMG
ncbi:MAG: TetR family transcriptional regulator [Anaerolineales bacterium]|nr:TetR family transcriptional regulator [Anaerolineales bacterium]